MGIDGIGGPRKSRRKMKGQAGTSSDDFLDVLGESIESLGDSDLVNLGAEIKSLNKPNLTAVEEASALGKIKTVLNRGKKLNPEYAKTLSTPKFLKEYEPLVNSLIEKILASK